MRLGELTEANQGGKTEHSGAKKGKGAYYGRKKEAKRDSNKNRRNADKAETKNIDEHTEADEKLWNADRATHNLAQIILANADSVAKKYDIDKRSPTYEAYLTKQIDNVERMLRNDIAHIRSSSDAFSGIG